jgi:voltage-gated sodium channel
MIGWILFHEEDPAQWGNIGQSLLSLFQILTLENWPRFLEAGQEIAPASWIFFVSYILVASFLVINILIAIIINSMEEVSEYERLKDRGERSRDGSVADRLDEIRRAVDSLEAQLSDSDQSSAAGRTLKRPTKGGRLRA